MTTRNRIALSLSSIGILFLLFGFFSLTPRSLEPVSDDNQDRVTLSASGEHLSPDQQVEDQNTASTGVKALPTSPALQQRALHQLKRLMAGDGGVIPYTREEFAFDTETRTALNPAHKLAISFEKDGSVGVSPLDDEEWTWSMRPAKMEDETRESFEKEKVARILQPGVEEWFTNDERGLEQGFEIVSSEAISTEGEKSRMLIDFETDLKASLELDDDGNELLAFLDETGRAQLFYHGLVVNDATGRELPSHFEITGNTQVALVYQSKNAVYPVTIDPFVSRELASFPGQGHYYNGSWRDSFAVLNGEIYFSMDDQSSGIELWKTDLTLEGTRLVKDIAPGFADSNPRYFVVFNGELYFMAYEENAGYEMWKSDGTEAGTTLVADINPGKENSAPNSFIVFDGFLYFAADGDSNGPELWKSDGTESGTVLVKDIDSRTGNFAGSSPQNFTVMGDSLYFVAYSLDRGREIWKTDGTETGTVILKDIVAGSGFSNPSELIAVDGTLFFKARGYGGEDLWKSDGTTDGTVRVNDISSGSGGTSPRDLTVLGSKLIFSAWSPSGREIWVSDGTADGTTMLKDISPGSASSNPLHLLESLGRVFFTAYDPVNRYQLWSTDGTVSGTSIVANLPGTASTQINSLSAGVPGSVLFLRADSQQPSELWKTDGTEAGTILIRSTSSPDFAGGGGYFLQSLNGNAIFTASNGNSGFELWKSDGTTEGTVPFAETNPTGGLYSFLITEEMVYFPANDGVNGEELWRSDGTVEGTLRITDINPGPGGSFPSTPVMYQDQLYFAATDSENDREIWRSSGQPGEFSLFREFNPTGSAHPFGLTVMEGFLYFAVNEPDYGETLWKSDGTEAGTYRFQDFNPTGTRSIRSFIGVFGGNLYLHVDDGVHGEEIWKTNGKADGTGLVKDIVPGGGDTQLGSSYAFVGDSLYFSANDKVSGTELWKTDGTEEGTALVKDISSGSGSTYPGELTAFQNKVFFTAADFTSNTEINRELWMSDGTEQGTVEVKDIFPGNQGSYPDYLRVVGDYLLFSATDDVFGPELWRTDGTEAGTVMVKELLPGSSQFTRAHNFSEAVVEDGLLYFPLNDGVSGLELWVSDGTPEGTFQLEDTVPGFQGSVPIPIGKVGDQFLFVGSTGLGGNLTLRTVGPEPVDKTVPDPKTSGKSEGKPKVDLLIGENARRMKGDNVYHRRKAGRKQTLRMPGKIFRTHRAKVTLQIENDGGGSNRSKFRLRARGTSNPGISTRVFARKPGGGRKVITGAMKRRGYTCNLAGGDSVRIKYEMKTNRFWAGVRNGRGRRENHARFTARSPGSSDNCAVKILFR